MMNETINRTGLREEIGERIRTSRNGVTQCELARRLGKILGQPVTQQSVSLWEQIGPVDVLTLHAIALALGVPLSRLLPEELLRRRKVAA